MGCLCEGPYPEFYRNKDHTAKKQYKCCECNKPITPGQRYRRTSGKWEGDVREFKTCESCSDIWDNLTALGYCITHEELSEFYQEHLDGIGSKKYATEIMGCVYTN